MISLLLSPFFFNVLLALRTSRLLLLLELAAAWAFAWLTAFFLPSTFIREATNWLRTSWSRMRLSLSCSSLIRSSDSLVNFALISSCIWLSSWILNTDSPNKTNYHICYVSDQNAYKILSYLETYSLTYCTGNKLNRGAYIRNFNTEWFFIVWWFSQDSSNFPGVL